MHVLRFGDGGFGSPGYLRQWRTGSSVRHFDRVRRSGGISGWRRGGNRTAFRCGSATQTHGRRLVSLPVYDRSLGPVVRRLHGDNLVHECVRGLELWFRAGRISCSRHGSSLLGFLLVTEGDGCANDDDTSYRRSPTQNRPGKPANPSGDNRSCAVDLWLGCRQRHQFAARGAAGQMLQDLNPLAVPQ